MAIKEAISTIVTHQPFRRRGLSFPFCHRSGCKPFQRTCTGFTLIELLVVIAIICIIAAILFPVFASAREKARQATCQSNERQILLAVAIYQQDFDDCNVPQHAYNGLWWDSILYNSNYVKNDSVFSCPDFPNDGNSIIEIRQVGQYVSYGMNIATTDGPRGGIRLSQVNYPAELGLLFDVSQNYASGRSLGFYGCLFDVWEPNTPIAGWADAWYASTRSSINLDPPPRCNYFGFAAPDARHSGGLNVGFFDSHVKWMHYGDTIQRPRGVTPANFRLWHPDAQ